MSDLLLKIIFRADGAGDVAAAVNNLNERFEQASTEAARADQAFQNAQGAMDEAAASAEQAERGLGGVADAAEQATGNLGGLNAGLDIVLGSLKGFVGGMLGALAGALSLDALIDATGELMQFNKELQDAERQLGVSAQALQVWDAGAGKVGISSEKMRDMLKDVSDKLGDFATTGGGEAADVIKRLGLNINDLINMGPDQALLKIVHALDTVKNISSHDRIFLLEALADEGSALYPLLKDNAALLREIEATVNRRGLIITNEERAILDQASATLSDMQMAGAGLKQEFGLIGAQLLNAFGPGVASGLEWLTGLVRDFRTDASLLGEVWGESFANAGDSASGFADVISTVFTSTYDYARMFFTYLPVVGGAAYQALRISGEIWGYTLEAAFNSAQGVAGMAFAAIVGFGADAFGRLVEGSGKAISFIMERFAAFVDSMSFIGNIWGFEEFGASISGVADKIRGAGKAAEETTASIKASFKGTADSIRKSAEANLAEADSLKAKAAAAEMARKAVIDNAATYIKTKESQRAINQQIREENAELEGAVSVLDRLNPAKKTFVANTEAEKKATDEAAKAAEAATRAYEQEKAALELQIVKLTEGDEAAYRLGLTQKSVTGARQEELVALKNQITQLEEAKKKTEEAEKAQEKIRESLKKAAEALSIVRVEQAEGKEAARLHALELEGYSTAQAAAQVVDESRTEAIKEQIKQQEKAKEGLKAAAEALSLARIEQEQGKEAARAHALELEGYTATQAAAQAADESRTEAIKEQIQQQEKIRDALKEAANALSIARVEQEQGKEAARLHALELEGYSTAQAAAQAADEKRTEAIKEQIQQQTKAKDEVKQLREELKIKTVALTQSAAAADLLKYKTEGYGAALAQTRVELDKQIAALDRQGAIASAVADGLTDAMLEAVKTGRFEFESLADSLEDTFNNMVLKPVIQAVMQPVSGLLTNAITGAGNGLAGALGLGNLFGSTGAAGSGLLGSLTTSITGAVTSFLGGGGLASSIGSVVGALGPVGLAVGAAMLFGKLFGGKQSIKALFGNSADNQWEDGGWYGTSRSAQALQRTTAFGTFGLVAGSRSVGRDSKEQITQMQALLDGMAALDNAFAALIPNTKEGQAAIDAVRAAMDGFTGNALDGVGLMTERAITMFEAMPEGVKQALQGLDGGLFKDGMKGVAERIQYVGVVAQQVLPQLSALGLKISQSWDLALRDAALLTDALGGTDAALKQLAFYVENFADPAELTAAALKQSQAALDAWNAKLGLSGDAAIDSKDEFEQYIKSLDLTTAAGREAAASAFQHMQAILAVDKAQQEAAENLAAMIKISDQLGIQFDALHPGALGAAEALAKLVGGMDALKEAAAKYYEAAYTDAERTAKEREAAQAKLDAFNRAMKTNIANILDLRAYVETLDPMTRKGRAAIAQAMGMVDVLVILGGTAEEIAAKTKQLKDSIADLIGKLYSSSTSATDTSVDDAASALDAARSALDGLKESYDAEKERIDAINQANEERYREELARYEGLKDAAQGLRELIDGLTDPIDDKLTALAKAQRSYNSLLQATQAGDADAAGKLGGSAQALRDALMNAYGGDQRSVDAIHLLEQQIADAANALDSQAGSAPTPANAEQGNLTELERLIASQQQLVDSLSKSSNGGDKATAASDRQALALELAKKIGELGLAQDRSVFELLKENGINLKTLAADFGINIGKLDTSMLSSLDKLADALNVDIVSLTRQLGGNLDLLGDLIAKKLEALPSVPDNIKKGLEPYLKAIEKANDPTTLKLAIAALQGRIDLLPPGIKARLNAELQSIIGNTSATNANIGNLIAKNKEAISELATSFGIDIGKLNQAQLGKLDQLADALHIDTVSLTTALGGNIDRLGNLISAKLGGIEGLSADIEKGLAPYLRAIEKANDPTELKLAIAALQGHIDQLPPDIKAKLNAELQSIIGNTSATNANIGNLIAKNKEAIDALAKSFGIDVSNLNQSQLTKLDKLADALHIDTVSLAAALGGNIDKMGDLIANKLGSLPGIPENIKTGLAPYLKAIELANDPTTLKTELQRLQTYVNSLPPDIKAKLNEQLGGILGNTGEQLTQAKTDAVELRAIRDVKAQVWEQTVYLRDGIGANWLGDLRANLRSLNNNAANVGKSAIQSYRVGDDALARDGLIYAHAGEAIYTPEQTDSMRKNSIAALQVLPVIAAAALKPTIQQEVIVVNTSEPPLPIQGRFKSDSSAPYPDLKPILNELQKSRDDNERHNYEIVRTAKATLRLLEDWDQYIAVEAVA